MVYRLWEIFPKSNPTTGDIDPEPAENTIYISIQRIKGGSQATLIP